MKRKRFRERYPAGVDRPRYGLVFDTLQAHAKRGHCKLAELGYNGPGHYGCWMGEQTGYTAAHLKRYDSEGLIYVCGRGHDLIDGRGGERTVKAFRSFLEAKYDAPWSDALVLMAEECARLHD